MKIFNPYSACLFVDYPIEPLEHRRGLGARRVAPRGHGRVARAGDYALRYRPAHSVRRPTGGQPAVRVHAEVRVGSGVFPEESGVAVQHRGKLFAGDVVVWREPAFTYR